MAFSLIKAMTNGRGRRITKLLAIVSIIAGALMGTLIAFSSFSASPSAQANTVAAGTLFSPGSPAASGSSAPISVSWTAATLSEGGSAQDYTVERYSGSGTDLGAACGGGSTTSLSCMDSPAGNGTFKYRITPHYGGWSTTSAFTNTVAIAPDAPSSVTLTNGLGQTNIYINSTNAASVNVSVALDANSKSTDTVTLTGHDAGSVHTFTATASGTAGAGSVAFNGLDLHLFNDGTITFTATVTDPDGVTSSATTSTVTKDTVAPSTTITISPLSPNGSNGWYDGSSPTFTLGSTDSGGSGVATTSYFIDSGTTQAYPGSAVTIPDGSAQTVSYWSADKAGNTETTRVTSTLKIDTIAPSNSLSLTAQSPTGSSYLAGNTIYYRGTGGGSGGSFQIRNAVGDGGSGPASSTTAALGGTASGWTSTPSAVSTPSGGPYNSTAFSWAEGTSSSPTEVVTGSDVAGNTTPSPTLTFTNDSTAPTGGALSVNGTAATALGSASSTTSTGFSIGGRTDYNADVGSGVKSSVLTVQSETYSGSACGSPGSGGPYTTATIISNTTQPAITADYCYLYTLTGSDNVGNTASISTTVTVTGPVTQLVFTQQPVGGVGEATDLSTQPRVSVEDSVGNVVSSDTGNVTLGISTYSAGSSGGSTQGSLGCTNNTVAAVAGVATFTHCQITGTAAAGTYTLSASHSGPITGTSSNVVINAGSATKLGFITQPGGGVVSIAWSQQPVVAIEDANGNTVTSAAATSITLARTSGQGTLSCTSLSRTTSSGVATWTGCNIAAAGSGNVLTASGTFTSATSNSFTIFAAPSVSEVATGFASGSSVTSTSFTPVSGATYLIFAAHTASSGDSATLSSGAWSSSTSVTSQTLTDGISSQWAWIATANTTSSSTATVNFGKATSKATNPGDNIVEVLLLSNANATTPILGTTLTASVTASKQLVANLPTLPTGGGYAVFVYAAGDTGGSDPGWNTGAGFSSLANTWNHSGGPDTGFGTVVGVSSTSGSSATYGNGGFPASNGDAYGTIALGLNPQSSTPTVTGVSPAAGTTAGGNTVTVTGTNLTGATAVKFGSTAGTSVSVNGGGTSLTVTAPAESAGTVNVTVTTPIGTSPTSSADQFTYDATPTVSNVNPNTGSTTGGTSVVLTGTGFLSTVATTGVLFGGTNATSFTVNSDTQITATAPAGSAGPVNVTVTNATGTSASTATFTYYSPPTVTSVSPAFGPIGGTTSVTVMGTNLTGETAVDFGATPGTSVSVNGGGTSLTVTSPSDTAGQVDVTVVTPGGTSATSAADHFTYETTPTVTQVSPAGGAAAGGTSVTITGTGFLSTVATTGVKFGSTNATSFTVNSDTQITATAPAGTASTTPINVTVTNTTGTSATSSSDDYTYDGTPTITNVNPNTGSTAGGTSVVLTGTGFLSTTAVHFGSTAGTIVTPITSDTSMTVTSPAGSGGSVNITVTNATGTSTSTATFTYSNGPTFLAVGTVQTTTGTMQALTVQYPEPAAVTGDFLLLIMSNSHHEVPVPTCPAGWTSRESLPSMTGAEASLVICYRFDAGETSVSITSPGGAANGFSARVAAFANVNATTPFDTTDVTTSPATTGVSTFTPTGLTTVTANALAVSVVMQNDGAMNSIPTLNFTGGNAQGFNPEFTNGVSSPDSDAAALADKLIAAASTPVTFPTWATNVTTAVGMGSLWIGVSMALRSA